MPDPLVDLAVLMERSVLTTNVAIIGVGFGMFGAFLGVLGFVQADPDVAGYGFGSSLLGAAVFVAPGVLPQLAAAPLVGVLARRYDGRAPITAVGATVAGAGLVMLGLLQRTQAWQVYLALLLNGFGVGMARVRLPRPDRRGGPAEPRPASPPA